MKKIIIFTVFAIINFVVTAFIHIKSITTHVNPYLSEEQRVEVGNMMLDITIPAFAMSSIVFALAAYYISKKLS